MNENSSKTAQFLTISQKLKNLLNLSKSLSIRKMLLISKTKLLFTQ